MQSESQAASTLSTVYNTICQYWITFTQPAAATSEEPRKPLDELSLIVSLALVSLYPKQTALSPVLCKQCLCWNTNAASSQLSFEIMEDWSEIIQRAVQIYLPGKMQQPNAPLSSMVYSTHLARLGKIHHEITTIFIAATLGLNALKALHWGKIETALDRCITHLNQALLGKVSTVAFEDEELQRHVAILKEWNLKRIRRIAENIDEARSEENKENFRHVIFCEMATAAQKTWTKNLREPILLQMTDSILLSELNNV